jgi:hypothetical protein
MTRMSWLFLAMPCLCAATFNVKDYGAAGKITGLKEMPIGTITFSGVHIQTQTGMRITNAKDVTFTDSKIEPKKASR